MGAVTAGGANPVEVVARTGLTPAGSAVVVPGVSLVVFCPKDSNKEQPQKNLSGGLIWQKIWSENRKFC